MAVAGMVFAGVGTASVAAAAQAPLDLFGLVRPDGVVVPALVREDEEWRQILDLALNGAEPPSWLGSNVYYFTDTATGKETVLAAGPPVSVCCQYEGNPAWAHSTDMSGPVVEELVMGTAGYAVTHPIGFTPFLPVAPESGDTRFAHLLDSLSTLPDSVPRGVELNVWQASLGNTEYTFFQLEEMGDARNIGCYIIYGWLEGGSTGSAELVSHGLDDCDGKGHERVRPWALVSRDSTLSVVISVRSYGSNDVVVWPRD